MDPDEKRIFRELYSELSDEELEEAVQNLDAYLEIAWEIFEEIETSQKFDSSQGSPKNLDALREDTP